MADGKVIIETDLDSTGIESGLSQLKGVVAKGAAALGVGKIFKDALESGISFESAFTGVKKTVDATGEQLKILKSDIRGMAKEMPESVEGIAGVAEAAGQLGIKTKSITGFTKTMVQLGDATNLSSESAATSLARFANITRMSQDNFDKLGSTVVALGNNLATTESEIVDMSMRIAGAGSQVGMTESQIMSFSGALSSVGIEAEAGGTAFSTLLSKMNLATTKGGDSLKNFADVAGMSSGEFKEAFEKDAAGAVISFIQGLDNVNKSGGSAIKVLDDMGLSDVRMRDALLRAAGASDQFSEAVKLGSKAWDENTALTKEAETRYATMESQLEITKNKLKDIGISVYDDLSKPMAKGLASANKHLDKFLNKIEKGGIKSLVPDEVLTGVENLGDVAKTVGGGGIKVLSKGVKVLADNLDVVVPLTTAYFGAMAGYKVFGLASAGVKTLTGAYKVLQAAEAANAITLNAAYGGFTLLQTVVGIFTGKISLATAATGAFNTVCTALGGPIGVTMAAVGALAAGVGAYALITNKSSSEEDKFVAKIKKSEEAYKEYQSTIKENKKAREEAISTARNEGAQADKLSEKLNSLMSVENKSAGQKEQIKTIVEKLNELLPDLGLAYDEEKDKLNKSTDAIQKNIAAQKELAMAKAYGAQMESVTGDIVETETKLAKATEQRAEAEKKLEAAQKKVDEARKLGIAPKDNAALQIALEEQRQMNEAYESADGQVQKYQKSLTNLNTELDTLSNRQIGETNYAAYLQDLDKLCEEAKIKAKEIPDSVVQGMKEGVYANPTTGEELNSLIQIDGILQQAKEQAKKEGWEIPNAIAQGIQSGQYAIPTSVEQIKALVQFNDLQSKTLQSGVKIPTSLAKGITSGKSKPAASIKQMNALVTFDSLVANSGLAGNKVVQEIVSAINSGKTKPAEAVEQMNALIAVESSQGLEKSGADSGDALSSGLTSKAGTVKKAGKNVALSGKTGASGEKNEYKSVGSNLAAGIASGIIANSSTVSAAARSAVRKAKDAARSEADINSPSKVFEKEVGKFLPLGIASGIRKNTGELEDASREMVSASLEATADELEIHSPSKKYRNAIGVNIPRGIASGVNVAKAELLGEMKTTMTEVLAVAKSLVSEGEYSKVGSSIVSGLGESLTLAKTRSSDSIQSVIDTQYDAVAAAHEKAESALQDKINKTKSKKKKKSLKKQLSSLKAANKAEEEQLKEAGEKVANAFYTAFEQEAERLTEIAQKQIQELSEKYQKEYDNIISLRDGLMSKQQSWGNVYDLEQNIFDIERYQEKLKALENNIPESMVEKILGMNVDEATSYMDWFQSMTQEQQKAYIENWNKQQSMAESFSKSFFADDIKKLESEYQTELKKATDKLQKEMNQIGANIAKGLTSGIQSETRTASTAMKNLCNTLIATAKKQLGIKSPSKKFTELGVYDIQGLEKGHEKEAKNLYKQMGIVSKTMAQRFAEANLDLPDLRGKMEAAVLKQMGRITANVRLPEVQQNTSSGNNSEQPVFVGPEKIEVVLPLEGREVARVTVPFMDQFLNAIIERKLRGGV